jgi:UDPglucose 6-dehydrogenase
MNLAVIGTGYVGLVTGTCFADTGNTVICVDNDPEKLAMLHKGEVPIYEPGLQTLFDRNVKEKRLSFTDSLEQAVDFAQIIFLALPTPPQEDGSADLQYVLKVASDIAPLIKDYKVIVNKSTVPVGTAEKVQQVIAASTKVDFDVVSNPEFLREGAAVEDFMKPDRVVVGVKTEKAKHLMEELYKPFVRSGNPIYFMDPRSSELTKYAANAFLATRISFMNEIANLCECVGADVDWVRMGIGSDSRIGKRFIFPGVGYGGSCFPKDVKALVYTAQQNNYDFEILNAVEKVNKKQKEVLTEKVLSFYHNDITGKRFAVWGLAFKPNTDDIREAPALIIIERLLAKGASVCAFDPEAMKAVKKYHPQLQIQYANSIYEAAQGVDALLIITEWNEFRTPDFNKLKSLMKEPVIFDGRNIYELSIAENYGFYYNSIGRKILDGRKL